MPYNLTGEQKSEIEQRYASIMSAFYDLKNISSAPKSNLIWMQSDQLYCVVASWVIDESRHVNFHSCNGLELHKIASYFAYWFVRLKPIQVLSVDGASEPRVVLVNEIFALHYICGILGIKLNIVASSKFYDEFIYMLRYRKFDAEPTFPMMRLLEISAKNGALSSY
jgi:hypothetical protein